jgi:hypothetical protein
MLLNLAHSITWSVIKVNQGIFILLLLILILFLVLNVDFEVIFNLLNVLIFISIDLIYSILNQIKRFLLV